MLQQVMQMLLLYLSIYLMIQVAEVNQMMQGLNGKSHLINSIHALTYINMVITRQLLMLVLLRPSNQIVMLMLTVSGYKDITPASWDRSG
jgi:hypothetical protein